MSKKDYVGCCGSCVHCDLTQGYTFLYKTTFPCTRYNRSVEAGEKACEKLEIARNRTNEIIEKYDR